MTEPVAELFADLGFKVDAATLDTAERGLSAITSWAERAVAAVGGLGGAFARMGAQARVGVPGIPVTPTQTLAVAAGRAPAGGEHKPGGSEHTTAGGHGAPGAFRGLTGIIEHATHVAHGFLGIFAAHEVMHFAHELMDLGSHTELTAKKLGLTTDAVQQLQYAAKLSDIEAGSLNTGLKFLQINASKAAKGAKEPAAAFRQLGVTTKNADGSIRPLDELFEDVATKIKDLNDPAKQTAMAVQLFGRAGSELVPLLQEGGEGIKKFREEAEELGGGITEHLIEQAGEMEHAYKRFGFAFLGVKSAIGNVLLPVLTKLTQGLTWLVGRFNEVSRKTKLLQTVLAVGLAAGLAKLVLMFQAVGAAGAWAWVKSMFGFIMLASVIAGVTLVLEDLYQTLTGGKGMIGQWLDEWQGIGTTSDFVKSIAVGIDTIKTALVGLWNSPAKTALEMLSGIGTVIDANFDPQTKAMLARAAEERANRAVATGRGLGAGARSNIDIPRATGRGLNAGADVAFGQAKASIFNAASANSDSVNNITINAPGADGKEIAKHVRRELDAHETKRNQRLRRALAPAQDE